MKKLLPILSIVLLCSCSRSFRFDGGMVTMSHHEFKKCKTDSLELERINQKVIEASRYAKSDSGKFIELTIK